MDDPTRPTAGVPDGASDLEAPAAGPDRPSAEPKAMPKRLVADAMRTLLNGAEVSVTRGDATRVINRAQPSVPPPAPGSATRRTEPQASPSSGPPGPRVDYTLWIVLAVGLFAIAGYMLSAAL